MDYARRFFTQRRLAITIFTLMWIGFSVRDCFRLDALDPSGAHHFGILFARFGGAVGMAIPVLLWSPRALDERWAVGLLSMWVLSCWFSVVAMMHIFPVGIAWIEAYPILTFSNFVIFMAFRLRVITVTWLLGVDVLVFHFTLYFWPVGPSITTLWNPLTARGGMISMTYLVGVFLSIPLERAARREFMYRRSLRAAKARVEAASRAINEQNERMRELVREKERFFSSAYHDIQQPLAAINLFIHSARARIRDGKDVDHDLDVIEETANDILDMFKEIQDFSELGSYTPRLSPIGVRDVLDEIIAQYRETARLRGIELRISKTSKRQALIKSDRALLKRALANLVSNAIKNTSAGGVVLGYVRNAERLRIDVWDTGIGIAKEHRESIFSEYYQINNPGRDRSKGLGLGLSIVHRVIDILPGHSLDLASTEGRGSRFSLYAPMSEAVSIIHASNQDSEAYTADLTGRFILLCDDEPAVLEGLRLLFTDAGALVYAAESMAGFETLLADDNRVPDLIVTDIRLRDGATGLDVASRIRRHFEWAGILPIVFITGELLSRRELRDFTPPYLLLRKSSAPERMLAEISRFATAHRTEGALSSRGERPSAEPRA